MDAEGPHHPPLGEMLAALKVIEMLAARNYYFSCCIAVALV